MANADYAPHVCWRLLWINLKRNTDIVPCRCNTEYNKRIVVLCCIMYVYYNNISNVCLFQTSSIRQKFTASNWHSITRSLLIEEQPMYDFREVWTYTDISREIFPFSSISDLKLHNLDWHSYRNMVIHMRRCVCDWCELPPPHWPQPVTPPVKLDNSSKGTFTIKWVMFVHWTPDMCIPSMIQPASWI